MNNGLQKIGKVDYDRGFRRKLRDMIAIFKRYSKEKAQKNLKYKNNEVQNTFKSCIVRLFTNYEPYWKEVFLVKKEFFFF